jgi:hypothetical protein
MERALEAIAKIQRLYSRRGDVLRNLGASEEEKAIFLSFSPTEGSEAKPLDGRDSAIACFHSRR